MTRRPYNTVGKAAIQAAIQAAEPLGATCADIQRSTGIDRKLLSATLSAYAQRGHLYAAGPKGQIRYYLTPEARDAAAPLRTAAENTHLTTHAAATHLAAAGAAGMSNAELASAAHLTESGLNKVLRKLRDKALAYTVTKRNKTRHFATQAQADSYTAALATQPAPPRKSRGTYTGNKLHQQRPGTPSIDRPIPQATPDDQIIYPAHYKRTESKAPPGRFEVTRLDPGQRFFSAMGIGQTLTGSYSQYLEHRP